jgi:U3 small nucleolar RNA-associated protein 18
MSDSSDSEFDDLAAAIKSFDSEKDEESSENEVKPESESEDEKPAKKPKRRRIVDPEEQKELDKFLFGDKKGLLKNLEGNKFFFTDTTGDAEDGSSLKTNECVWHDSDDEDFKKTTENGEIRNKRKFDRITGVPNWARIDKEEKAGDDSSDDDEISKTVGHLAKKVTSKDLEKDELAFKRLAHINKTTLKEGRTSAIIFHPNSTVGIVAGLKGMVSMFAIDGRENKKVRFFLIFVFSKF